MEKSKSFLFVAHEFPVNNSGGANIRNFYLLKELSKYYKVTLLVSSSKKDAKKYLNDFENICEVIVAPSFFNNFLYKIALLRRSLKKILKGREFDYIQVEHSEFGNILKGIKVNSIKILDFHNVNTFVIGGRKIKNFERKLAGIYDVVLCCSSIEKERLIELGYRKIIIVPNGVDTEYFNYQKSTEKEKCTLFVGRLKYHPNIEGLEYYIQKIFPLLNSKLKFNIVGEYNEKDFKEIGEGIKFHGYTEDVRPLFKDAIFVCPVLNGGGTRLKILTAFASGAPVVSTIKGAEGIDYKDGENILIANTANEFKEKILQLFNEPLLYKNISENSRKIAETKYDWHLIAKNYFGELQSFKKNKIAIFHNYFDNVGGAEIVALILAKELEADIYTTNFNREKIKEMGFDDSNIFSIGEIPLNPPFKQEFCYWKFKNLKLGKKYDLYIIGGDWAMSGAKYNKPNIWYAHSPIREIWDLYQYNKNFVVKKWQKMPFSIWVFFKRWMNKVDIKNVDKILCSSLGVQNRIKKYLDKEAVVVNPPVDIDKFHYNKNGDFWLSVNRLYSYKRVDMQIKAFKKLPEEKLIIIGPYEETNHFLSYKNYCESIKPENVEIINKIDRQDLIELYANCKGFITTSQDEDFGISAVEAIASGKPVIASNQGGYKETLIDEQTGILIDEIDEAKLIDAIKKLSEEIGKNPLKFKNSCREQAEKFSTEIFIKKIKEAIKNI